MDTNWKFAKNVVLLDSAFIYNTVRMIREVMSSRLGRLLPPLDLVAWLDCLLLDAGIREENAEVQVLLTHDAGTDLLGECEPSSLSKLDGQACRTALAEYTFYAVSAGRMVTSEELYTDLLRLTLNDAQIEKRLLIPSLSVEEGRLDQLMRTVWKEMGNRMNELAEQTLWFRMQAPDVPLACHWCSVVPSLAHVLGIRSEEME